MRESVRKNHFPALIGDLMKKVLFAICGGSCERNNAVVNRHNKVHKVFPVLVQELFTKHISEDEKFALMEDLSSRIEANSTLDASNSLDIQSGS